MIPKTMAEILKFEHVVGAHNIEWLKRVATHVIRNGSTYMKVSSFTKLQIGDKVIRSLRKGDPVFFNRFPTLDNVSGIGYTIDIWKDDTNVIALHQTNTPAHNADFDGDEGNIHVGNEASSRIEMEAMTVKYRIMRTKSGEPMTGIVYNGIVGCYLLSQDNNLSTELFNKLIEIIGINSEELEHYKNLATKYSVPFNSGRTILSMLLPRTLKYKRGDVLITEGFLIKGKLTKSDVADKLICSIFLIDRWEMPYFFVNTGYKVASYYVSVRGVTLGIKEYCHRIEFDEQLLKEVDEYICESEKQKQVLTESGRSKVELRVLSLLGAFSATVTSKVKAFLATTGGDLADTSYNSGARGSIENVSSAIASIGQLYGNNNRLSSKTRLSPYASVGSKHIVDNGFILSSYASGLTPSEVMAQAVPSREAAFTVYRGTPESGAASRQACLHLGGIIVNDRFEVIGRNGEILSFLYGIGADTIYTSKKPSVLDKDGIESPVDWLHTLETL